MKWSCKDQIEPNLRETKGEVRLRLSRASAVAGGKQSCSALWHSPVKRRSGTPKGPGAPGAPKASQVTALEICL